MLRKKAGGEEWGDLERGEQFKFALRTGEQEGFFARGTVDGWVLGSRNPKHKLGRDDHVTLVIRDGDLREIHRTVDGTKHWSRTAGRVEEELRNLLASDVQVLESSELRSANTYIASLTRLAVVMRLLEGIGGLGAKVIGRRFLKLHVKKEEGGREVVTIEVDWSGLERLMAIGRRAAAPFSRPTSFFLSRIGPKFVRRLGKLVLIDPLTFENREGDTGFLASATRAGLLSPSEVKGRLSFLPLKSILERYEELERSLPFGKLGELPGLFRDGTQLSFERRSTSLIRRPPR